MKKLESLALEKSTGIKHLELQLSKAMIKAGAKSTQLENLLQENREVVV